MACEPLGPPRPSVALPFEAGLQVPPNVQFVVHDLRQGELALREVLGDRLAETPTHLTARSLAGAVQVFQPAEPLMSGATYMLDVASTSEMQQQSLSVSGPEDTAPPAFSGLQGATATRRPAKFRLFVDCPSPGFSGWVLDFGDAADDRAPASAVTYRVYAGPDVDSVDFTAPVAVLRPQERALTGALSPDSRPVMAVVVTAVDWAGNESARHAPVLLEDPRGCQAGGGAPAPLALLGLILLWRRRGAAIRAS